MTSTPCSWAILLRLKSLVTTRAPSTLASTTSRSSTLCTSRSSARLPSCICSSTLGLFCIRLSMSRPRRPRLRLILSELSAMPCNSCSTKRGTISLVSMIPVSQISAIRPSMMTLVSRTSGLAALDLLGEFHVGDDEAEFILRLQQAWKRRCNSKSRMNQQARRLLEFTPASNRWMNGFSAVPEQVPQHRPQQQAEIHGRNRW